MKIKYIIQLCILAALVLTACTDELSREQVPVNGHGISFSVSVTNGWDAPASGTRGLQSASISEPVQMEGGGQTPDFMYNLKASKGSSVYETTTYWPSSETNIRFYAYAPYSADADGITLSSANVAGVPTLAYEVPEDVTDQSDLLATLCDETASAAHTSPQAMELHHLLTAVCFKTGDNMAAGTINKITLKNIKYKGTYTFPSSTWWTSDKGSWAIDSDVKDFVYTPSTAFTTDGTANVQVNTGENAFIKEIAHRLMEYQTFPKVLLSSCVKMRIKNTKNTIKPTAL